MTVTVAQLRALANDRFTEPSQVSETIVRFVRRSDNAPFAVYYFDVTKDLPQTEKALAEYQTNVLAERFFTEAKSLQWNTYLFFVPPPAVIKRGDFGEVRSMIEADRGYARKQVISESQLPEIFSPSFEASNDVLQTENILSIWTERLQKAGIDEIVWRDADTPARLDAIETSKTRDAMPARRDGLAKPPPAAEMIKEIRLVDYRLYPVRRDFSFGRVNLICGANAAGKTSLLEAIELLYCGRHHRAPDDDSTFDVEATYVSGKTGRTTEKTPAKIFRDRNLHWYGQHEIKTHHLADSFAKYNFLNTDAAVELTDSTEHVEDDLAKLLIGPDASRIWHTITGLESSVRSRLRDRNRTLKSLTDERTTLRRMIAPDTQRSQSSDILRGRLVTIVEGLSWGDSDSSSAQLTRRFIGPLSQLTALCEQAMKHGSSSSESIKSLDQRRRMLRTQVRDLSDLAKRWQKAEQRVEEITQERRTSRAAKSTAQKIKRIVTGRLLPLIANLEKATATAERYTNLFADFDRNDIERLRPRLDGFTLRAAVQNIEQGLGAERSQLRIKRGQLAEYQRVHARAASLIEQLQDLAREILKTTDDVDVCPLCETRLPKGQLRQHLAQKNPTAQAELTLTRAIRESERRCELMKTDVATLGWLDGFSKAVRIAAAKTLGEVYKQLEAVLEEQKRTNEEIARIEEAIAGLEERGISLEELEQACDDLAAYGYPLEERTAATVDAVLSKIDAAEHAQTEELTHQSDLFAVVKASFNQRAEQNAGNLMAANGIVARIQGQHDTLEQCLKSLAPMLERFPWPDSRPLSKLIVESSSIEKMASDLQAKLVEEEARRKSQAEANKRLADIDKEAKATALRVERLDVALKALQDIQANHSLTKALEQALQENREAIEFVFRNIHSPHEFSGLGESLSKLHRISPDEDVELTQISTGQRAALALSIFLAQNGQLAVAPPVILIDDPIAHIDDLNCLSFLDYLRELVLAGNRQIFFATANDKLAALITRKFDFLGDAFQRIDLARPALN